MKKSNLTTIILTTITTLFLMTGLVFAQDTTDDAWVTSGNTYVESGNVGIGTASPTTKLHVEGGDIIMKSPGGENRAYIAGGTSDSVDTQMYLYNGNAAGKIRLNTNGDSFFNGGNVGIGTSTPNGKFHVYSSSYQNRLLGISDISLDTTDPWQGAVQIKVANTGNNWLLNTVSYSPDGKGVRFYNNGGVDHTAFEIAQAGGTRFIVDGTGNVGIGTTSPGAKLDVIGISASGKIDYTIGDSSWQLVRKDRVDGVSAVSPTGSFDWYTRPNGGFRSSFKYMLGVTDNGYGQTQGLLTVQGNGNIGIGTTNPGTKLDVMGISASGKIDYTIGDSSWQLVRKDRVDGVSAVSPTGSFDWYTRPNGGFRSSFKYMLGVTDNGYGQTQGLLTVQGNGNIGIGTTSPQSKLAVNGTITTKEVKVTETGWSDFVFEDNYALPSLDKVESFIKENKHLPDIPSAKQVEEEGLSMAEMMAKQMQKIEELTLYVIELKKENETIKKELAELKK